MKNPPLDPISFLFHQATAAELGVASEALSCLRIAGEVKAVQTLESRTVLESGRASSQAAREGAEAALQANPGAVALGLSISRSNTIWRGPSFTVELDCRYPGNGGRERYTNSSSPDTEEERLDLVQRVLTEFFRHAAQVEGAFRILDLRETESEKFYPVQLRGRLKLRLPIRKTPAGIPIAYLNCRSPLVTEIQADKKLASALAEEIREETPPQEFPEAVVTIEGKGETWARFLADNLGLPLFTLTKKKPLDQEDAPSVRYGSVTTKGVQTLYMPWEVARRVGGLRVLVVDDVISSGESMRAASELLAQTSAHGVRYAAVLREGEGSLQVLPPDRVLVLGVIPFGVDP